MGSAIFVDYWRGHAPPENVIWGYTYVLVFGALFLGMASPVFMALVPEPLMHPADGTESSIGKKLTAPFRDRNFRQLTQFLLFWGFALNMATPFFAVYMLVRLGLPLSWVIALSIVSQLFNLLFLRVWGPLVDRFGNKAVLSVCASLYLLVILGWTFTTMPEKYILTIPLLVVLHVFAGIANAGVTLSVATIGLKLAPRGQATPYLAGASLASSLGTGLGPLVGGLLADFFSTRQLNLTISWISPGERFEVPALSIIGFDFLFGIAFILGIFTLGILPTLREEGEVSREEILESLVTPIQELSRPMSSVPEFNLWSTFPFGYLKRIPVPGLDAALGVTVYQIAEVARVAASAVEHGRLVTEKLVKALENGLSAFWGNKEQIKERGVEITREAARGAFHVVDEKRLDVTQVESAVTKSVIEAASHMGVDPREAIVGASQGVIEGAAETKADLGMATVQAIEAAREIAAETRLSEELAVALATEGIIKAAEAIGSEAVAQVKRSLAEWKADHLM